MDFRRVFPIIQKRIRVRDEVGFSLVEVCLAVGIIAFAVLPLIGLLSIGLDSYRDSVARGRATQALGQIAASLQFATAVTATTTSPAGATIILPTGEYTALAPFDKPSNPAQTNLHAISWRWDQGLQDFPPIYFDENGDITTVSSGTAKMVAKVVLTAPTSKFEAGTAQIAVGWPATAAPTYSSTAAKPGIAFYNIQGHVESTVSLLATVLP